MSLSIDLRARSWFARVQLPTELICDHPRGLAVRRKRERQVEAEEVLWIAAESYPADCGCASRQGKHQGTPYRFEVPRTSFFTLRFFAPRM